MGNKIRVLIVLTSIIFFSSCGNESGSVNRNTTTREDKKILQQTDGTISLEVGKAECYEDKVNPSTNTAEWNVVVSKSGRFNVWLSSATTDTTKLGYNNSVMLSILDKRLEIKPSCDKIIQNSGDVKYPFFRADSFMGSLYIQDTGLYNIQVISDRIIPVDGNNNNVSLPDVDTKLLSVIFKPIPN
jgi:hypothetical protein